MSYWIGVKISGVKSEFVVAKFDISYPVTHVNWLPGGSGIDNAYQFPTQEMAREVMRGLCRLPSLVIDTIISQHDNRAEVGYGHKRLTFSVMKTSWCECIEVGVNECFVGMNHLTTPGTSIESMSSPAQEQEPTTLVKEIIMYKVIVNVDNTEGSLTTHWSVRGINPLTVRSASPYSIREPYEIKESCEAHDIFDHLAKLESPNRQAFTDLIGGDLKQMGVNSGSVNIKLFSSTEGIVREATIRVRTLKETAPGAHRLVEELVDKVGKKVSESSGYWITAEISGVERKFVLANFKATYPITGVTSLKSLWLPGDKQHAYPIEKVTIGMDIIEREAKKPNDFIADLIDQCDNAAEIGYGHKQITLKVMHLGSHGVAAKCSTECFVALKLQTLRSRRELRGLQHLLETETESTESEPTKVVGSSIDRRLSKLRALVVDHKGVIAIDYFADRGFWSVAVSRDKGPCISKRGGQLEVTLTEIEKELGIGD